MGIYQKRADGEQVQTFTCRISTGLYNDVKEYAYQKRLSVSLALEDLISRGLKEAMNEEDEKKSEAT